jgi:TonB family protein
MNWSRKLLLIGAVLTTVPAMAGSKKQEEGKALMSRAKQLSDIRGDGQPAFRMKVSFKTFDKGSAATEGSYTETWASRDESRSETIVGDFRRVVVVNGSKRWTLSPVGPAPLGTGELGFRMDLPKFSPDFWKTDKIEDRESTSGLTRCLESQPDFLGARSALCFDKTAGLLTATIQPGAKADHSADQTCTYSDYQKFGEKAFPRQTRCSEDHQTIFESTLLELITEASPDPALFAPLSGSRESVNCRGIPNPPKATYTPNPFPPRPVNPPRPVILSLSVGTDGIPADVKVVRSIDAVFDSAALEAVRRWRFKPAGCDGQPIESQINVAINFTADTRSLH